MENTDDLLDELRAASTMPSPDVARLIRINAKVPQTLMARALGVNRTTLARWETGVMMPRVAMRARYARLLADLEREVAP